MIFAGFEPPHFLAALCVQRVQIRVPTPDKDRAIGERRRSVNHIAGFELPFQRASRGIQRIDIGIAGTEINRTADDNR